MLLCQRHFNTVHHCIFLLLTPTTPPQARGLRHGASTGEKGAWIPFFFAAFCTGVRNIQAFAVHWFTTARQETKRAERQSMLVFCCPQSSTMTPRTRPAVRPFQMPPSSFTHVEEKKTTSWGYLHLYAHFGFVFQASFVTSMHTSVHAVSCRWPSWPVQVSRRLWHWGPPWTSSLASFCHDGSTWGSPPVSLEDLWQSIKTDRLRMNHTIHLTFLHVDAYISTHWLVLCIARSTKPEQGLVLIALTFNYKWIRNGFLPDLELTATVLTVQYHSHWRGSLFVKDRKSVV